MTLLKNHFEEQEGIPRIKMLCLGLFWCKGKPDEKVKYFCDLVNFQKQFNHNKSDQRKISKDDKELRQILEYLIEYATITVYKYMNNKQP